MKKFMNVMILTLIAVFMVSCGDAFRNPSRDDGGDSITLRFLHIWPEHQESLNKIANDFTILNPDIIIETTIVPFNEVDTVLNSAVYGGTVPDVFFQWTHQIDSWARDGVPLDLTPYLDAEWINEFTNGEDLLEMGRYEGDIYNIPFRSTGFLVLYNKTFFEQNGYNVPESIQEFDQLMQQMTVQGIVPLSVYGSVGGTFSQIVDVYNKYRDIQTGAVTDPNYITARLMPDAVYSTQNGFTQIIDDSSVRILQKVKGYRDRGYVPQAVNGMGREDAMNRFIDQRSPMILANNNELGILRQGLPDNVEIGAFAIPGPAGVEERYFFGGLDGFSVSSATRYPAEAVAFVKYLTSLSVQQAFSDSEKSIMVNKGVVYTDPQQSMIAEEMADVGKYIVKPDYQAGQYGDLSASAMANYLGGTYSGSANDLMLYMINNADKALKDAGLTFIEPVYDRQTWDDSWLD
ncbi:MAG: extracellular solute-binding protein [Acholeplasmataceae bacterium]|nr:extracellular solute-binding protein [Acholeplasmataceae bacterium]